MTTRVMQFIDQYFGQILCRLLSLVYRRKEAVPAEIRRIVVIKMFGIGSIVLMTPMMRALKKKYPGAEVSFITLHDNNEIPRLYDITPHVYSIRRSSFVAFVFDSLKTVLCLRRRRMDISIDAEFFSRYTAALGFLIGARYRIGFFTRELYRGTLIDFHAYFNPYRHMIRNFFELISPLSCFHDDMRLTFPDAGEDAGIEVRGTLDGLGIVREKPVILANPNVSDTSTHIDRSWPLENFSQFARHCISKGYQVVFIGSASQAGRSIQAARLSGDGALCAAGAFSLRHLLALMRISFMLVTNDSGPLHLAVSAGLPTFSFFGTESPKIYGHESGIHHIFYRDLACSPCLSVFNYKRGKCEYNSRCIRGIDVGEVISRFDTVENVLRRHYADRMR